MSRKVIFVAVVIAAVAVFFLMVPRSFRPVEKTTAFVGSGIELAKGRAVFEKNCMACHGSGAQGSDKGPPLVHRFYEPNHHADVAFQLAVQRGVRQHHWNFGDMKPVPGVSKADIRLIVGYVRNLQKEAGIF